MEFKLQPIEVPEDDPFKFDALERRASVEAISSLLDKITGPFVLAIDSPWGTGKTTFIRMLKTFLEKKDFICLHFNAWETDFTTDPLIAFMGELDKLKKNSKQKDKTLEKTKKIAALLAKKVLPVAGKIATAGLLDLDTFTKEALAGLVSDTVNDAVDAYTAEKTLIEQFHKSLKESIDKLKTENKKSQLIVFVDEVDRCRPTFAIELLERIKHLFNVPNAIFIISLDKQQLSVSLSSIYGTGFNSNEYLRRFIDLEYSLPIINAKAFTKNLFLRFGFDDFFSGRTNNVFHYDRQNLEDVFNALSDLFGLNLRAREQCCTRISVAMMTTPNSHHFYPFLLTALVVLKEATSTVYRKYVFEDGTASHITNYLKSVSGGEAFLKSHIGSVIEAYLIAVKHRRHNTSQEFSYYKKILDNPSSSQDEKEHADLIVKIISQESAYDRMPSLAYVANKIELAAQFQSE